MFEVGRSLLVRIEKGNHVANRIPSMEIIRVYADGDLEGTIRIGYFDAPHQPVCGIKHVGQVGAEERDGKVVSAVHGKPVDTYCRRLSDLLHI